MSTTGTISNAADELAKAYYSLVIESTADEVWAVVRDFNNDAWKGGNAGTRSDNGKSGDELGAVRLIQVDDMPTRHVLTAHSDTDRFYTYAYFDTPLIPVQDYQATIRVTPTEGSDNAYVEYSATFHCANDEQAQWQQHFTDSMITWLNSLNGRLIKS